jgi:hypothetical protein
LARNVAAEPRPAVCLLGRLRSCYDRTKQADEQNGGSWDEAHQE